MSVPWLEVGEVAGLMFLGGMKAVQKMRERKYGIGGNPKRCAEHAHAINRLNDRIDEDILPDLGRIKAKLEIV
jgi:hypothetical protein